MKKVIILSFAICFLAVAARTPAFAGWDPAKEELERMAAELTIAKFKEKKPGIELYFDNAYAYAVFPKILKGAFLVGAAQGKGLVYAEGEITGKATLNQVTVGFQGGGQSYSQIIFFSDKVAFDNLINNQMKFSGTASAVAFTKGASAAVDYEGGVSVFTMGEAGLMLEASMGGQQFEFEPKSE
jgi:lipid-binding SYLF domain-containing protein